ncbi:uncharacterized protein VP01_5067g1 [Puccinia sorghi]|uniref:Retrovirus-related Pol polyprotein from transposon TNT 1-94-like beta-barrel domain-containing protein n=1 Tax=Puccinia sorghi TaxID=27349 RepID=A0A0L6UM96_9BASI|nr:uncharacterized protein VP01_5067g1 [Puccinia sorghi]
MADSLIQLNQHQVGSSSDQEENKPLSPINSESTKDQQSVFDTQLKQQIVFTLTISRPVDGASSQHWATRISMNTFCWITLRTLKAARNTDRNASSLSANVTLQDTIILDSGATGYFLEHKVYFHHLSLTSSSVFGANGHQIPILGFGPATIPTMAGPLYLSLAYYAPSLLNLLISLVHFIRLGFSVHPVLNGSCFECRKNSLVALSTI